MYKYLDYEEFSGEVFREKGYFPKLLIQLMAYCHYNRQDDLLLLWDNLINNTKDEQFKELYRLKKSRLIVK